MNENGIPVVKPGMLILVPGPNYYIEHSFKNRLLALSKDFEGLLFTTGSTHQTVQYGDFHVHVVNNNYKLGIVRFLNFCTRSILYITKLRLQDRRIDLIVTYDPLKTGLVGVFAKYILKAKLAPEVNGDYTNWTNYQDVANQKLRTLKREIYIAIERYVLGRADGIKTTHMSQLEFFDSLILDKSLLASFNYCNVESFTDLGEEKTVLLVGYPLYVKGVDVLIEAFKKLASSHPDWRLKIMGWYPDMGPLEKLIGSHPQIFHHPPVSREKVPEHIGKCGIFVLPSRTEGVPRVLMEAMAAGKPRIGTKVGGIPQLIEHDVDGFLVPSENTEELSKYLDNLMSDAGLRHRLGKAGAKRALRDFSIDAYYEKVKAFYFSVLDAKEKNQLSK
ncbi:MAG: glycosyltransferase [Gammaproteobacteria bacterium]|nr:glycosyltransferase [Gammaproteobacteria bacterium]